MTIPTDRRIRRGLVASAAALAFLGGVAIARPAHALAADECRANDKTFTMPRGPDVTVRVWLCVSRDRDGLAFARSAIYWHIGPRGTKHGQRRRFDAFSLQLRLEHNGADVRRRWACGSALRRINEYANSELAPGQGSECKTKPWSAYGSGWSADGRVEYDIHGDGEGRRIWHLHGSPLKMF